MARAPNEKLNKALSLYQKGYKLVDIAKELDIPVDEKIREELNDMCNLSEGIEEKGMKKGE